MMPRLHSFTHCLLAWLSLLALILVPYPAYGQADAAPAQETPLTISAEGSGVRIRWDGSGAKAAASGSQSDASLPLVPFGGYLIPLRTVLVESGEATAAVAAVHQVESVTWTGELTRAPELAPPALDWEPPAQQSSAPPALPAAPLFELYSGVQRGRSITVWAFSPLYQDPDSGEVRWVERLDATIPGAPAAELGGESALAAPDQAELFTPVAALADAPGPSNPLAGRQAVKVFVSQGGMQQIDAAALAGAGLNGPLFQNLRIYWRGQEVALHERDLNGNGVMDGSDSLLFYAPAPADRWNPEEVYWLVEDGSPGLRMATRNGQGTGAPVRSTAFEYGRWQVNKVYNSTAAGADGDHWFHLSATVDPAPSESKGFTASLAHLLPLSNEGGMELTLHVTALNVRPGASGDCTMASPVVNHKLTVQVGASGPTDNFPVDFSGRCREPVDLTRSYSPPQPADSLAVTLEPVSDKVQVLFDAIDYRLPVSLNFDGKGASFAGVEGTWRYQLSNLPANATLYDITDPLHPVIVTLPDGVSFEDGPQARRYLLSGEGVVWTPRLAAHAPVDFGPPGAHTIYIAPASLQPALQPLVQWRRSQGYTVAVVTPQAIYDSWSYGQVDPQAIRSFLRYVVGNWSPAPIAAVLVGDGTWDPWNFLGHNNPNHIPPYLADGVDPWLNETACDNCYGQLDGDNPIAEAAFMPDIWIGRFPVADSTELQAVVSKILGYEQDTNEQAGWRRQSLQLADDYVRPDGEIDNAGNFPGFVERIIALLPTGVNVIRNYFSGTTDFSMLTGDTRTFLESLVPWFVADPDVALRRNIQIMNAGVGLVTFTGHSNHWQWGRLAASNDPNSDKRMMGLWDVEQLNNRTMPFIALSMTCYTSQFPIPAPYHFTLDEHLFLHDKGGAVAVWGPAGLSVAHGHDKLQVGFYQVLWSSPPRQAKLGALTQGGYAEILRSSPCCIDINRTYLLLGDPLTPARVDALPSVFLPTVQRVSVAQATADPRVFAPVIP